MSQAATRQSAPERSAKQRRQALELANYVRGERAALKAALKRGTVAIDEFLTAPPTFLATAKVADLLLALPSHGPVKFARLLERCRTNPVKTVAGLSERQRSDLLAAPPHD